MIIEIVLFEFCLDKLLSLNFDRLETVFNGIEKFKKWLESQKADRSTISSIENFIRYLKNEEEKIGITA